MKLCSQTLGSSNPEKPASQSLAVCSQHSRAGEKLVGL